MRIVNQHDTIQATIVDVVERGFSIYIDGKGNTPGESYPGTRVESSFKFHSRNEIEDKHSDMLDHELIFTPVEIRVTEHKGNIKEHIAPLIDQKETHTIDENIPLEFVNTSSNVTMMRGKMEGKITDLMRNHLGN